MLVPGSGPLRREAGKRDFYIGEGNEMRSIKLFSCVILMSIFLIPGVAFAHSGGLDSKGGHYNRKTGEYHYHRGSGAADKTETTKAETKREQKKSAPKASESKRKR